MRVLRVNENKITTENVLNGDYVGIEGKHRSNNDEKTLL